jgi:hypothetical protein
VPLKSALKERPEATTGENSKDGYDYCLVQR